MDWGLIVLVQDRFKLGQMDFQIQVQTVLKEETNIRIIIVQMPVFKEKSDPAHLWPWGQSVWLQLISHCWSAHLLRWSCELNVEIFVLLTCYWQEAAEANETRPASSQSINSGLCDVFWIPNKLIYTLNPNGDLKTLNALCLLSADPGYYNNQERGRNK